MKEIALALPSLGEEEIDAVAQTIRSGWVTQGPRVLEFEREFASFVGARHACAVSSCTTALHLALLACGVRPGDVVLTVSHSFIATSNAVRHCIAEPVFVDIDPAGYNMDPKALERSLTEDFVASNDGLYYRHVDRLLAAAGPLRYLKQPRGRLAAILVVHQVGMPADLRQILPLARRAGVPLVEDAACASGSEADYGDGWEKIGRPHGDIACFSFHPRKVITTGDGGMITTGKADLDGRCRLLRQHAMSVTDLARHNAPGIVFEEYCETGYNYRMSDVHAAMGLVQLRRLPEIVAKRRALAELYRQQLSLVEGLRLPQEPACARSNWQSFVVGLPAGASQLRIMTFLKERGIASRRGVMCAHMEAGYLDAWPAGSLPASEAARDESIVLPFHQYLDEADVVAVAHGLRDALKD